MKSYLPLLLTALTLFAETHITKYKTKTADGFVKSYYKCISGTTSLGLLKVYKVGLNQNNLEQIHKDIQIAIPACEEAFRIANRNYDYDMAASIRRDWENLDRALKYQKENIATN